MEKEYINDSGFTVETWKTGDIEAIYTNLEEPNWPPWLVASQAVLEDRRKTYGEGQILIRNKEGDPVASVTTNRVNWDNYPDPKGLPPTWDSCAGKNGEADFGRAYDPSGNAIVLLAMNVNSAYQGMQLPSRLIRAVRNLAVEEGAACVISPFRPSGFGQYKHDTGNRDFMEYCELARQDGLPVDGWIRNLERNGGRFLGECPNAMVVTVSIEEWKGYKDTYKPDMWHEVSPGVWDCGETGEWVVNKAAGTTTYSESNIWGIIEIS